MNKSKLITWIIFALIALIVIIGCNVINYMLVVDYLQGKGNTNPNEQLGFAISLVLIIPLILVISVVSGFVSFIMMILSFTFIKRYRQKPLFIIQGIFYGLCALVSVMPVILVLIG